MSRQSQLQDHLAVIANQCDLLEDLYPGRSEAMTAINVIRNAAQRILRATQDQSSPESQLFVEGRRDSRADPVADEADAA